MYWVHKFRDCKQCEDEASYTFVLQQTFTVYMCHDVNKQITIQKVCDCASATHGGLECEMHAALYKHRHIHVRSLGHERWMRGCVCLNAQRANTGAARHDREHRAVSNPSGRNEGRKEKNRSQVKENEQKWGESFRQEFKSFHIKLEGVC